MHIGSNGVYYTVYKITNLINNKIYIGKHKTSNLDDTYMGSGKILKHAIKKHGIDNFIKEYLFIFDNEEDMNNKENEIVSEKFIKEDTNYNINVGGDGGWDYINSSSEIRDKARLSWKLKYNTDIEFRDIIDNSIRVGRQVAKELYPNGTFYNKKHTEETKLKMSKSNTHMKGSNNSQYGMMWIYSLEEKISKRIKKDEIIPDGWYKGRKIKFN